MTEQRVRAALRELADAAPMHPNAQAAMNAPAAPARRWRPLAPGLAAAAVLVTLVSVVMVRLPSAEVLQPGASSGPTLPDRFPAFSFLQGVTDGRFGSAIALYANGSGHEDFTFSQLILAGAESDTYRRLEVPDYRDNGGHVRARLSPDGTKVAIGGTGITVLDLITGDRAHHPVATSGIVVPLAFSPNGRRVTYLTPTDIGSAGPLSILDTATGVSTAIADGDVLTAAFSPDGSLIAYQSASPPAGEIEVSNVDGSPDSRIPWPPHTRLAGPMAWSPDGRFLVGLATNIADRPVAQIITQGEDEVYVFQYAVGTGPAYSPIAAKDLVPRAWGDSVIGWRSPTRMLVSGGDVDGTTSNLIAEVDVAAGSSQVISRFTVGDSDDLAVSDVQLATGLLADMSLRHSTDPDRGLWPTWVILVAIACITAVAAFVLIRWKRRRLSG
jgi:WD40 repeat protein